MPGTFGRTDSINQKSPAENTESERVISGEICSFCRFRDVLSQSEHGLLKESVNHLRQTDPDVDGKFLLPVVSPIANPSAQGSAFRSRGYVSSVGNLLFATTGTGRAVSDSHRM
jgi:hypothetical protein